MRASRGEVGLAVLGVYRLLMHTDDREGLRRLLKLPPSEEETLRIATDSRKGTREIVK